MAAKPLTINQMRALRARLTEAQESLGVYINPDHEDCVVARAARIASAEYLDTWVMAQLEGALVTLDTALGDS
jgi:hypothetical protein